MKQYQHLFFDLDHTLWDFEKNSRIVLQDLYNIFKLKDKGVPDVLSFQKQFEQQNKKFWLRFRKRQINRDELRVKRFWHTLLFFHIRDYPLSRELSEAYLDSLPFQPGLVANAREVLDYLREKGYGIHLITNGFEDAQRIKLQRSGIDSYFKEIVTSQNCGCLKPDSRIFAYALKAAKADITTSLMIGDSLEADVLGAQEFGMSQVFFNSRKIRHVEKPSFEISELIELRGLL